jgi:hypothetical protein
MSELITTTNNLPLAALNDVRSDTEVGADTSLSKSERARILVLDRKLSQYRASKIIGISPQFVSNVVNRELDKRARVSSKG